MFQYCNSFSYSSNPEIGEFLLTFRQQHPVLDNDGNVKEIATEPVASIVINRMGLEALKQLLNQIQLD